MKQASHDVTYCTNSDCTISSKCQRHVSNNYFNKDENYWYSNPTGGECLRQNLYIPKGD